MRNDVHEFRELARRAGARDLLRIEASARLAIHKGMAPAVVLDGLLRNAGYLFAQESSKCL